jgi:voltage-gated sodium channel
MRRLAGRIVHARLFEYFLVVLIVGTSILMGVATSDAIFDRYEGWIVWFIIVLLLVLFLEVLLKLFAELPRIDRYFRDPWNIFDFLLVTSVIGGMFVFEAVVEFALLVVVVRLLRLLQGLTTIRAMRLILTTMFRSLPDMAHILLLLCIVVYLYAISGHNLLKDHDPEHWGSLGKSVLSLFQVVTLDGWSEIMQTALEVAPFAWIYFVSLVIVTTFIGANLFIAIVVSTMDEAKEERLRKLELPGSRDDLLQELHATQQSLRRLEGALQLEKVKKGDPSL